MGIAFYFLISWVLVAIFAVMKKRLSLPENSFVYLITLIVSVNWAWIIYEEIKLIELSKDPLDNAAFMINRSIGVPMVVLIATNLISKYRDWGRTILTVGISVAFLVSLILYGRYLEITKPVRWNVTFDVLYFTFLHAAAFYGLKGFRHLRKSGAGG